ncbi:MAG: DUF2442 domain-containing protein [Blastocatellia bacterium]
MAILKAGKWTYTDEELDRMFEEADRRGKESLKTEIQARAASYDRKANRLVIELKNGVTLIVPCDLMQGLRDADPKDIAAVEIGLRGASLHWEKLDQDFTIGGLVRGIFGTKKWMAELERENTNSKHQAAATRAIVKNGRHQRKITAAPAVAKRSRRAA